MIHYKPCSECGAENPSDSSICAGCQEEDYEEDDYQEDDYEEDSQEED